jgi:hypothetical protein
MNLFCKIILGIYLALCVLALVLVPLSHHGVWGIEPAPLSGIFAILLASPWVQLTARWVSETSVLFNLFLVALCMLLNAAILFGLCFGFCRFFRRRKSSSG